MNNNLALNILVPPLVFVASTEICYYQNIEKVTSHHQTASLFAFFFGQTICRS